MNNRYKTYKNQQNSHDSDCHPTTLQVFIIFHLITPLLVVLQALGCNHKKCDFHVVPAPQMLRRRGSFT